MKKIKIWIGKEGWKDLVGSNPVVFDVVGLNDGFLDLRTQVSISVTVGRIQGGQEVLLRKAAVKLLHQSSHRWYDDTLVRVPIGPDTPFDVAVIKAADAIAGAFNTAIVDEK